jgi:hypothetical protein
MGWTAGRLCSAFTACTGTFGTARATPVDVDVNRYVWFFVFVMFLVMMVMVVMFFLVMIRVRIGVVDDLLYRVFGFLE